ncbi:MAG: hypothetical protein KGL39_40665 [Patescibacteria group bacterium]|nr:hypothetical protein [Patescibacteria group bacterium]
MGIGKIHLAGMDAGRRKKHRSDGADGGSDSNGDGQGDEEDDDDNFDDDDDGSKRPLTIAEVAAELVYAGKSLSEVAGLDEVQLRTVYFIKRDKYGSIVRERTDIPQFVLDNLDEEGRWQIKNPKSYRSMFQQVMHKRGLKDDEIWKRYEDVMMRRTS